MGGRCMGYVINYGCGTGVKTSAKKKRRMLPVMAGMVCLILVILGAMPGVRMALRDFILPGDGAETAKALQNLASDLRSGEELTDAVTAFCHHIIAESGQ